MGDIVVDKKIEKISGERWLIPGPIKFIPRVEEKVIEKRSTIPLDKIEGIYIRDIRTGIIKLVKGECYMLKENEERWEMLLSEEVEQILQKSNLGKKRVKSDIVTFKCPFNAAV